MTALALSLGRGVDKDSGGGIGRSWVGELDGLGGRDDSADSAGEGGCRVAVAGVVTGSAGVAGEESSERVIRRTVGGRTGCLRVGVSSTFDAECRVLR
jgi:hypothetical protein